MPSNQLLSSKIVFTEVAPGGRGVPAFNTCVVAFEGVCEKGPINTPTLCMGFADFKRYFGGYIANSDLAACVEGFFANGGVMCYVNRVVHYTDIADPTTGTAVVGTYSWMDVATTPANTLDVKGKYAGSYANGLTVQVAAATSGSTSEFNLYVLNASGVRLETFPNLSMSTTAERYCLNIVNDEKTGSTLISLTDKGLHTMPAAGSHALTTGADGIVDLVDADYVGSAASWTGLYAFDTISDLTVLAVPGVATAAVHQGMLSYCETRRQGQLFAILDPPADQSASEMITYVGTTATIENLSEFGAIYWPRIKVANPSTAVYGTGTTATIPPSGDICGVIARTDNARPGGVWDQPAGTETGKFSRVLGFENDTVLSEDVRDLIFPHRINPLTTMEGFPRYIDGARTLKGGGNFPSIGQRRGISFCERSIKAALEPMRHKNNNTENRAVVSRTVFGFLKSQMDLGAFATKVPETSFYVDFGDALQTAPNVINGMWGVATTQPAEFIVMKVSQDTRAADAANQ
jgi:uncharacterized protein